jgi:uncharacterized protein (UPF0179 family)
LKSKCLQCENLDEENGRHKVKVVGIITLVGKQATRAGYSFVFSGQSKECRECVLRKVCCDKLELGRVYVITKVRDKLHNCPLHEEVQLVEVEEAPVKVAAPSQRLFEGAIFTVQLDTCDQWDCPNRDVCFPTGLIEGDRVQIEEIIKKSGVECSLKRKLGSALVRRVL